MPEKDILKTIVLFDELHEHYTDKEADLILNDWRKKYENHLINKTKIFIESHN
jgi:hypothetical protein